MSEHAAQLARAEIEKRPDVVTELIDVGKLSIPVDDAGEAARIGSSRRR